MTAAKFQITFSTTDATNAYSVSSASYVDNIGTSYYSTSPTTETFTANLSNLMSTFSILGGTHGFTAGDPQAKVDKIRIYGDDFTLYSICLADNSSYSSPEWEIDSSDFGGWTNVTSFKNDDGDLSDTTTIDFQSSYLHVTKTVVDPATGYQIDPSTGLPYGYPTTGATTAIRLTAIPTSPGLPYGYPTTGYPTTGYPTTGYPTTGTPTVYTDPRTGQQYIATGTTPTTAAYPYGTTSAAYPYGTTSAAYPYGTTSAAYPYGTTSQRIPTGLPVQRIPTELPLQRIPTGLPVLRITI